LLDDFELKKDKKETEKGVDKKFVRQGSEREKKIERKPTKRDDGEKLIDKKSKKKVK
jgi:hypothetical protein